ncbi:hypothetical protein, unknown function [Leishmania tarentolae]|uniref:Uncharacterized protein n=1 Tax=Leishmania tarentolae TaxID=5689 RepID=A0A640KQA8_LEITA|nr:hypothetical protein, unknown function [Leishmania tarentolae]
MGEHVSRGICLTFMSQYHHGALTYRPVRSDAVHTSQALRSLQRSAGGRYLLTMDRSWICFGERLPFASHTPVDGFVVVAVGATADALISASVAWDEGYHVFHDAKGKLFFPGVYGSAEYLPRRGLERPLSMRKRILTEGRSRHHPATFVGALIASLDGSVVEDAVGNSNSTQSRAAHRRACVCVCLLPSPLTKGSSSPSTHPR